jgi:glyoxylase I family protein
MPKEALLGKIKEGQPLGENVEKVLGIGGHFFRARDPAALSTCYQDHLGIAKAPTSYAEAPWQQQSGATVFAPFPQETSYFGDLKNVWMVNFRVRSLDAMVAQLRAAGIAVEIDAEQYPNGRFARLYDPEGNPIELWQPQGRATPAADKL